MGCVAVLLCVCGCDLPMGISMHIGKYKVGVESVVKGNAREWDLSAESSDGSTGIVIGPLGVAITASKEE